jgi:hypothetical protein
MGASISHCDECRHPTSNEGCRVFEHQTRYVPLCRRHLGRCIGCNIPFFIGHLDQNKCFTCRNSGDNARLACQRGDPCRCCQPSLDDSSDSLDEDLPKSCDFCGEKFFGQNCITCLQRQEIFSVDIDPSNEEECPSCQLPRPLQGQLFCQGCLDANEKAAQDLVTARLSNDDDIIDHFSKWLNRNRVDIYSVCIVIRSKLSQSEPIIGDNAQQLIDVSEHIDSFVAACEKNGYDAAVALQNLLIKLEEFIQSENVRLADSLQ